MALEDGKLITGTAVRKMLGGISDMTLWRWRNSPEMGFPKEIRISKRCYWRKTDIETWLQMRSGTSEPLAYEPEDAESDLLPSGVGLRDWFASQAILAATQKAFRAMDRDVTLARPFDETVARYAYAIADAMLEARS